ncbi:hypothetical protein Q7C_821 [Methylophaga frappieri]|uniref:Uncharacterized protein n=1 Tax=Methylophaga frappieri (strain ATCC BAA-2434 / DSM 25690 / JAM7) TaxID=754477 RepID=I1YGE7_METFJ|nr:hypothetical protein [Methylophaga frappieri]AFJ01990.1 hypothetical protein Q7C_821 [Methylophaga frappieri]
MKALKWILIILVLVPVVLVLSVYIRTKASGPVGWAKDYTTKELKAQMKDPDSMVIRNSYVVQQPSEDGFTYIGICGIVDGKNGFGGYSGGSRFVSISLTSKNTFDFISVTVENPKEKRIARGVGVISGFEKVYWNNYCVDAEHPPLTVAET